MYYVLTKSVNRAFKGETVVLTYSIVAV